MFAYVGSRTTKERGASGVGISVYEVDKTWRKIQEIKEFDNPSYLCFDNENKYLYAVHGDKTHVSSYRILENGKLEFLNIVDIKSKNPVYIVCDKDNTHLIVATLQGGSLISIKRNEDGSLMDIVDILRFEGKNKEDVSCAHQCYFDKEREFLFVPTQARHLGYERLNLIEYNKGYFKLVDYFNAREYAEPRHVAISSDNEKVYLTNEKDNSITYLCFDRENKKLIPKQTIKTIPDTFTGKSDTAGICLDKTNRYAFVSNRFSDIITSFYLDENGYAKTISHSPSLGKTPRFITIFENKLFILNEESHSIVEFDILDDGSIKHTNNIIEERSPVCLIFRR